MPFGDPSFLAGFEASSAASKTGHSTMIFGIPTTEFAYLVLALLVGGLVTGFLAGLLGIGGGGIIVPVFYELFGLMGVDQSVRTHVCVGTALAIIIPTSIRAVRSHWKRGGVDPRVLYSLAPWVVAGAIAGVFIAGRAPGTLLRGVFVASTLFMASRMAFGKDHKLADEKLPGQPWDGFAGVFIGLISTLIGIGGGAYITAYMRLFGWPMQKAVGTASGFGPIIAIPAGIGYILEGLGSPLLPPLSIGYVNLLGLAIVAPISVLSAPLGVRVAHKLSRRNLELAFVAFLLFVATRFTVSLIWPN